VRGDDQQSGHLFSYLSPEQRVPADHPLRAIRMMTDAALQRLSPRFERLYAATGRPSVPPEQLLRGLLLQVLYSVRSERLLMEQLTYNLLFRWFVGLGMDDPVWTPTTFTKNRERLLDGDIARAFFEDVVAQARGRRLLSDEHFTVDGTLLEAWAGQKSFQRRDVHKGPPDDPGNPTVDFHGERRSNATHASTTDPESRLFKKARGHEAKLAYLGEVLMENRHGLVVDACVVPATGTGERDAAISLIASLPPQRVASRLCAQSTCAETDRRDLRVDEDDRRTAETAPSRGGPCELAIPVHRGGVQPGTHAHVVRLTPMPPDSTRAVWTVTGRSPDSTRRVNQPTESS
jgi:transposase